METLKHKLYHTLYGEITLTEFEQWLYSQADLVNMIDKDIIFELFSFDYVQKDAKHELEKLMLKFFDTEEFNSWKILNHLERLSDGCTNPESIFLDFLQLADQGYSFLEKLGYAIYELEEYYYLPVDIKIFNQNIQSEAKALVLKLNKWTEISSNHNIKNFEFDN